MSKKVLGKGLDALIPSGVVEAVTSDRVIHVPLASIIANPHQPRKTFDDERLSGLSDSVKQDGVLQPIVVRRKGEKYELIMGERRVKAARLADISTIPAVIKDVTDVDSLRLALVENIQRADLNAIEVANAYRLLMGSFALSQQELARMVGRERSSVANTLRLLNLPEPVQQMIVDGALTGGHARALLALPTQREQLALAKRVVEGNLSVRQTEVEAGTTRPNKRTRGSNKRKEKPAHITALETALSGHLSTRVTVEEKRGGKGKFTIEFYSHEDFERLASLMQLPLPR